MFLVDLNPRAGSFYQGLPRGFGALLLPRAGSYPDLLMTILIQSVECGVGLRVVTWLAWSRKHHRRVEDSSMDSNVASLFVQRSSPHERFLPLRLERLGTVVAAEAVTG